jgi:hypothetical protein
MPPAARIGPVTCAQMKMTTSVPTEWLQIFIFPRQFATLIFCLDDGRRLLEFILNGQYLHNIPEYYAATARYRADAGQCVRGAARIPLAARHYNLR